MQRGLSKLRGYEALRRKQEIDMMIRSCQTFQSMFEQFTKSQNTKIPPQGGVVKDLLREYRVRPSASAPLFTCAATGFGLLARTLGPQVGSMSTRAIVEAVVSHYNSIVRELGDSGMDEPALRNAVLQLRNAAEDFQYNMPPEPPQPPSSPLNQVNTALSQAIQLVGNVVSAVTQRL
eukprot:c21308_g1_i1.p1 GENE.c21308_g1_i1~~c21308_g1_i1.p1  ORF type:complete len:177 (+),score=34.45 c21308_g1_i1:37-567(+)